MILRADGKVVERVERPKTLQQILSFLHRHVPSPHPALDAQPVVQLRFPKLQKLSESAEQKIGALVIELLRTSQFNSESQPAEFDGGVSRVQANYRKTAGVPHLVLSFRKPQKFQTIGGEIRTAEVVVGLSHESHHSSLFTVDGDGQVVEHSRESLPKGTTLLEAIRGELRKSQR